jgi:hypothetical protein
VDTACALPLACSLATVVFTHLQLCWIQAIVTESLPGPQPFGPLCIRRHALVCLISRWHLDNSLMPTHNTTSHVCPITGNTYTTHLPTLTYGTQDTSQGPDITGHMCERLNVSSLCCTVYVAYVRRVHTRSTYADLSAPAD